MYVEMSWVTVYVSGWNDIFMQLFNNIISINIMKYSHGPPFDY